MSGYDNDIVNVSDLKFDTKHVDVIQIPLPPNTLSFDCDDFVVSKRKAEITYKEPLFIQQMHTLIFNIDGKEYRFERK